MTRIDFYILPDVDTEAQRRFACRLAHKAVSAGSRVHVHVDDEEAANDLDALMWEYPSDQFLPHAIADSPTCAVAPVVVAHREPASDHDQLLINLAREIPPFFGRFERVAEIIVAPLLAVGRNRYRFYREHGYPLYDHKLDDWES